MTKARRLKRSRRSSRPSQILRRRRLFHEPLEQRLLLTGDPTIYFSTATNGSVDGISYNDEDILVYDSETDTFGMHFDGSDVGLTVDVDAVHIEDPSDPLSPILLSIQSAKRNIPDIGSVDDSDIIRFVPTSLGADTAGTFEFVFDGSDVGLTRSFEDIDAITRTPAGELIVSTTGNTRVPATGGGNLSARGADLLKFNGTTGASTTGDWEMYLDGSDVGLGGGFVQELFENVSGSTVLNNEDITLSTRLAYRVPGLRGDANDIITCVDPTTGPSSSCTSFEEFVDLADEGLSSRAFLDGFHVDKNFGPQIISPATFSADENQTVAGDVQAVDLEDAEGAGLTFSLSGGADQGLFSIDPNNGVLTFDTAPNFELPGDDNGDNDYEVQVTVTDSGLLTDVQDIVVTVDDVNEDPTLIGAGDFLVDENTAFSVDLDSSDPEGETDNGGGLAYSLGGADASLFSLNTSTGLLSLPAQDFENPGDSDPDGVYEVSVTVTDSGGLTDTQTVTVTVEDVNEDPTLIGAGDFLVDENTAFSVDLDSSDPEGETENGGGLIYSLGGADAGLFSLNTSTGLLSLPAQDFENPGDSDPDGVYEVSVTVTDSGGLTDTQAVTVTVEDVNEDPTLIGAGDFQVDENTAFSVDLDSSDPEGETDNGGGLAYSLGGADAGLFSLNTSTGLLSLAAQDFENPVDSDPDGVYTVDVTVTDSGGLTDTQTVNVEVQDVNEDPTLIGAGDFLVDENTAFSVDLDSSDPEGETDNGGGLSYSLGGADAGLFSLNTSTGLLSLPAQDFENPGDSDPDGVYEVSVTVTDSGGLTDTQTVSVTVEDVNEDPTLIGAGDFLVDENMAFSVDLDSSDPEGETDNGGGLTYSLGGADAGLFSLNTSTGLLSLPAQDFENPGDSDPDGVYEVSVTVTDSGGLTDTQAVTVTVEDVNEDPALLGAGDFQVDENLAFSVDLDSSDPEGETDNGGGLIYSLGGADSGLFTISVTGLLELPAQDFESPADSGSDNTYTVDVTVTDSGGLTDTQTVNVEVLPVNEAPTIDTPFTFTVDENSAFSNDFSSVDPEGETEGAGLTYSIGGDDAGLFTFNTTSGLLGLAAQDFESPADDNGDNFYTLDLTVTDSGGEFSTETITVEVLDVVEGPEIVSDGGGATANLNVDENTTAVTDVNAVGGTGTLSYTITGGADQGLFNIATATGVLSFDAAPNFEVPGDDDGNGIYEVQVTVTDANLDTDVQDLSITVDDVNEGPVALDLTFDAIGNVGIMVPVAEGLIDTATDPEGDGISIDSNTNPGDGTLSLNPNGSFTYTPDPGFSGTDSFTYTLIDDGTPNETGNTATVTITVDDLIWFIDSAAPGTNEGTLDNPFQTIAAFNGSGLPGPGDNIYLAAGSYSGPINLQNLQQLIGEGATDTSLQNILGLNVPFTPTLPGINGTRPSITNGAGNGINLAANNTILGVNVGNTSGVGVTGTSVGTLTIDDVSITGDGVGIDVDNGDLDATFDEVSSTNNTGIDLTDVEGSFSVATGVINAGSNRGVNIQGDASIDLDVTLQSVSSSGGSDPGIQLSNTTGSFSIVGDGSDTTQGGNGSGGTISNKTGVDGPTSGGGFTNGVGVGIVLDDVEGVSLNRVQLNDFSNFGIFGRDVAGFTFENSTLNGANGTSAGADEGSMRFLNLTGTASVDNSEVSGGRVDNLRVNNSGGPSFVNLSVTDSDFAGNDATDGDDGIKVETTGSAAATLTVTGSTFSAHRGDHIQFNALATAVHNLTIGQDTGDATSSNTFTGGNAGAFGQGITVSGGGSSVLTYNIVDNSITDSISQSINVSLNGTSTNSADWDGTIDDNVIEMDSTNFAQGILVSQEGSGAHTSTVTNNSVRFWNTAGIQVIANNGDGELNATVTGNTILDPLAFAFAGVYVSAGGAGSDSNVLDIVLGGSGLENDITIPAGGDFDFSNAVYIEQFDSTNINLPGYAGTSNNASGEVETFVDGNNTINYLNTAGVAIIVDASGGAPGFTGNAFTPLLAGATADGVATDELTADQLAAATEAAIARWQSNDLTQHERNLLNVAHVQLADLPAGMLGAAHGNSVFIDPLADGFGWSPRGMDLQTVVAHELGHVLGLADIYDPAYSSDLMYGYLSPGVVRAPSGSADFAFSASMVGQRPFVAAESSLATLLSPLDGIRGGGRESEVAGALSVKDDVVLPTLKARDDEDAWAAYDEIFAQEWDLTDNAADELVDAELGDDVESES